MPRQFTNEVSTPIDLQFGADEFVDTSNPLEGLAEAAKGIADLSGAMVLKSLENDQLAEMAGEESLYEEIRRKKRQLYDAASSQDEEAVGRFSQELEELTIAERQGAVSGTNASIRKESLLRSYINRFPHREEQIRQQYSALRRANQEARAAKVTDPIEEGIDDAIKSAASKGISLVQELDLRQHTERFNMMKRNMEERTMIGQAYEGEFESAIDRDYMSLAYMDAAGYIQHAVRQIEAGADVDNITIQRHLTAMREGAKIKLSQVINDIIANSPAPDATLSREFRAAQANKIDEMYNGFIQYADNIDTLKNYARGLTYRQNATIEDLRKVDPMMRTLIDIGAPEAAGKFLTENWANTQRVFIVGGASGVRALMDNAPNPAEKARYRTQLHMLENYGGQQAADDFRNVAERGAPPEPTGDPYVDAAVLNTHSQAILQSDLPTQMKDNAVSAVLEAEKQDSGYLTPGSHWYKDPTYSKAVRSSPQAAERMRTQLVSAAPVLVRELQARPNTGITFAPDIEKDSKHAQKPWVAYPSGGPWTISDPNADAQAAIKRSPLAGSVPGLGGFVQVGGADNRRILTGLNNMYWITRMLDGKQAAEAQALEMQQLLAGEGEGEGGEEAPETDEGLPVFDLTD